MRNIVSIILAAGKSKRMKSNIQKIVHEVAGKPMIKYVIETLEKIPVTRHIIVISSQSTKACQILKKHRSVKYVVQKEQLGTGHAVVQSRKLLNGFSGTILVVCGDTPLVTVKTLKRLIRTHITRNAAATLLTTDMDDPGGYGRIIHNSNGSVQRIVEQKDTLPEHRSIKEINTGTYCFNARYLFKALSKVTNKNKQQEYYLTDVIEILAHEGYVIEAEKTLDSNEAIGINNRRQLAQAQSILRRRKLDKLMDNGVTIIDPDTTFIDSDVSIGMDTVVYPCTFICGKAVIGKNCCIGPLSYIGNKTLIKNKLTIGTGAIVKAGSTVSMDIPEGVVYPLESKKK